MACRPFDIRYDHSRIEGCFQSIRYEEPKKEAWRPLACNCSRCQRVPQLSVSPGLSQDANACPARNHRLSSREGDLSGACDQYTWAGFCQGGYNMGLWSKPHITFSLAPSSLQNWKIDKTKGLITGTLKANEEISLQVSVQDQYGRKDARVLKFRTGVR